jgi:AcrR family transcriptional regulator
VDFEKLSNEKRQTILNAGIFCFWQSGYKKTAISEIATEAGISKAAIFHYFGTKKDLYLFLYKFAYQELLARLSKGTEDYFESLSVYIKARIQLAKKHPGIYEFLRLQGQNLDFEDIDELIRIERENCEQSVSMLFDAVDWNRFQEGYTRDTVMNLVAWVGEGCLAQLAKTTSEEDGWIEVERYIAILKKALYKPEYL